MNARSLVIFSSLPEVGGHTTTTLKLCELLQPMFGSVHVLVKDIPGHGFSPDAFDVLRRQGIHVVRCPGRDPVQWWKIVSEYRGADVFLAIGMRHLSPILSALISARKSIYYHITHELTPAVIRQMKTYRLFFSQLAFISPATAKLFPAHTPSAWALQPTELPIQPGAEPRRPGRPRVGFLGRLNEAKGLAVLMDLVGRSTIPCELHVAGSGPMEDIVLERQRRNPETFFFHGSFSAAGRAEFLRQFFSEIDFLCVPSMDDREGMPNVILEALQFGVPVLATCTGGMRSFAMPALGPASPDVVQIVEPTNFPAAFRSLLSTPPPTESVRERCRAYFEKFFSDSVLAVDWGKILGSHPR